MEPFKAKKLPCEYGIDKELLSLISEANQKYGEYKSHLSNLEFDYRFFLDSILLNESLKSTQIEGTQISQDDMYQMYAYSKRYNSNNVCVIYPVFSDYASQEEKKCIKLKSLISGDYNKGLSLQIRILLLDMSVIINKSNCEDVYYFYELANFFEELDVI